MANETKKYASLSTLQTFKNNLDNTYATQSRVNDLSTDVAYIDPTDNETIESEIESAKDELKEYIDGQLSFVTPQMYGAVGDGVHDDTDAFEDALSKNDNVFVPSGKYLITRPLNLTYKKSLYSNDGQHATIYFNGNGSVVNIGRLSVFRNINIRFTNEFVGTVFNTHNHLVVNSGQSALESDIGHVNVFFEVASPNATLIGITVDSGTDPNNMPRLRGVCYQTYHDIRVEYGCEPYGYGIKMELIEGRQFTEETTTGFPWFTHIDFDDVFLGSPYTAIKAGVTTASGITHFNRVNMGHIMFHNVSTQYRDNESTRYFLDLDHFSGYFTDCIGWDYHPLINAGEKVNIVGEEVKACVSGHKMISGSTFLKTFDFTTETEYTVDDNPEYFINKYFPGTVLIEGYDIIDAKIQAKLSEEYIANITEEKIDEVLYSSYSNVLEDPLTQIKHKCRWSNSGQEWIDQTLNLETKVTTVIIPVVKGGNIIRWNLATVGSIGYYTQMYFFNNDELTDGVPIGSYQDSWDSDGGYLQVDNPSGYKYVSIPFDYNEDISPDTLIMTINREITGDGGKSYTEYLRDSVIDPTVSAKVAEEFEKHPIPTKTSELTNDSGFITAKDIPEAQVPDLSGYALKSSAETWTFTLADGSTVTKKVVLA